VVHGGFDSYAQELYPLARAISQAGYEAILFEGPGQGAVIRKQGIPFATEWEKPDAAVAQQMQRDPFTRWGIEHGTYVFGIERPYDYLRRMKEFSTRRISSRVEQDFLLLAGTDDHYMPLEHFHRQARALTNVRSFTGRIFTREESGHTHCQCGNLGLALHVMLDWVEERTASRA